MDILICRILYPNDPTNTLAPHQNFVGELYEDHVVLYSISSLLGKEKRVLDDNGNIRRDYYILQNEEQKQCNLKVPSFIDCRKSYKITLDESVDLYKLSNREIPEAIKIKIHSKIRTMVSEGNHIEHSISLTDFKYWNNRCVKN